MAHKKMTILTLAALAATTAGDRAMAKEPSEAAPPAVVGKYGVFEFTFRCAAKFVNPFSDARAWAEFTSPSGKRTTVEGFHDGGDRWRFRFAPTEEGKWKYTSRMDTTKRAPAEIPGPGGSFTCKGTAGRGFLRPSKRSRYRLEHADGTPFYPVGIQTCGYFQVGFDGPGPEAGRKWRTVPAKQWCEAFRGAVNLIRWQLGAGTKAGCALALIPKDGPPDR